MAKRHPPDFHEPLPGTPLPVTTTSRAPEPLSGAPAGVSKWRVALNCPTPLAYREMVVEAATEQEARDLFMTANGICGSNHDWTVERLSE